MASKKRVVVLGGGAAGHLIAHQLQDVASVTLVDPKDYFEVPMALPRLLVQPGSLPAQVAYKNIIPRGNHVKGTAFAVDDTAVVVELAQPRNGASQMRIPFDYLVLATGSRYMDPLIKATSPEVSVRERELLSAHARLKDAAHIVIVGGGPVGVEIAGELVERFPGKSVALVEAGPRLLPLAPTKFGPWATDFLKSKGVSVVLNDSVASPALGESSAGEVVLKSGRKIVADTIIWAVGVRPVTEFLRPNLADALTEQGLVRVTDTLQVKGHPKMFAVGDLTNLPEGKLAIIAGAHTKSVVANIKRLLSNNGDAATIKPYAPQTAKTPLGKLMIVTLGSRGGLTSLPFGVFRANWLARNIKAKDMLVGRFRKELGLK